MKISIIGLGYVGIVCSACFAKEGHDIIGVDIDPFKVNTINNANAPIIEKDLNEYIENSIKEKKLLATNNLEYAILNTQITIICVGTPSKKNDNIDLTYIKQVAEEIGKVLKNKNDFHVISMRSTVLPGTATETVIPLIEQYSHKHIGIDFGYISNPEFLREGTAIWDFYHPPKTVIGFSDYKSRDLFIKLYNFLDAPLFSTEIKISEMIKYIDNAWHATKVTFANEIGIICKTMNIDADKVSDIFCADTKLNISKYYLTPGFAFGGSCLPKDVKAITYKAKSLHVNTPLLNSLIQSNNSQIERILQEFVLPTKKKNILILGISFKSDTDDLRESPIVILTEKLIEKKYIVQIYDKNVLLAKAQGLNTRLLEHELPDINTRLVQDMHKAITKAEVLIIGNKSKEFLNLDQYYQDKIIIDLVRISKSNSTEFYKGIAW